MELSPETCRVKPLRRINAIVASCWNYFTILQLTQFWQIPRHRTLSYSLLTPFFVRLSPSGGIWKYAKAPSIKKTWRDSIPIHMLLSAVSVLVVAQSSSEIPEGLMNNPVFGYEIKNVNTSQSEHITYLLLRSRKSMHTSTQNKLKSIAALLWGMLSLQVRLVILIRLHATHRYKRSCHYGKGSIMTILFSSSSQYYQNTSLRYKYYTKRHGSGSLTASASQ